MRIVRLAFASDPSNAPLMLRSRYTYQQASIDGEVAGEMLSLSLNNQLAK